MSQPRVPYDLVICPSCRRMGCDMCKGQGQIQRGAALFYKDVHEQGLLTDDEGKPLPPRHIEIEELP